MIVVALFTMLTPRVMLRVAVLVVPVKTVLVRVTVLVLTDVKPRELQAVLMTALPHSVRYVATQFGA